MWQDVCAKAGMLVSLRLLQSLQNNTMDTLLLLKRQVQVHYFL